MKHDMSAYTAIITVTGRNIVSRVPSATTARRTIRIGKDGINGQTGVKKPVIMGAVGRGLEDMNTFIPEPLNSAPICPHETVGII